MHIAQLTNLRSLDLSGCRKVFLPPIATMTSLTSLELSVPMQRYADDDMRQLPAGLTCLKLRNMRRVTDLTPILSLTRLTSLSLLDCSLLPSTQFMIVSSFTALKTLILSNFRMLDDVGVLEVSQMPSLTTLSFTGSDTGISYPYTSRLTDLSVEAVSRMSGLTSLCLPQSQDEFGTTGLSRVDHLSRLVSLTHLEVRGSYVVSGIMEALACMPLLTSLDLNQTSAGTLILPPLTSLTSLSLARCSGLTDRKVAELVAPLETSLTCLDLSRTGVTDVTVALGSQGTHVIWKIDLRGCSGLSGFDQDLFIDGHRQLEDEQ